MPGIIGKKVGMTSIFSAEGKALPCTVVEAGPCVVTQVKTAETDGYDAVQVGFGERKEKNTPNALKGHFKLKNGEVVATNKAARAAKRAKTLAAKQGVLDVLSNFLDTELFTAHRYWSVRQSNNSKGFIDYVDGVERDHVLWALTKLVEEGKLRKIGLKKNAEGKYEELEASEVNAFQIRYVAA